jgi:uncharacterized protein YdiU (UPF0061 family)
MAGWKIMTRTWTPNTTDKEQQRYRFGNQPQIAGWNLNQLANAIAENPGNVALAK